ncbi:hypothetical protein C4D60_Mb11t15580 [Musa balbisiana]|uniref:Uncharacterized protein n=1 Tax=Musa balbisiana TaxID=52838 RepID=A0A4V4H5J3_MUSBA|nr:hypothetical protein C4D60_Mb11t15580 [Musa balbisiana]
MPVARRSRRSRIEQGIRNITLVEQQVPFGRARGLCDEIIIEIKCNSSQVHVAQQLIEESVVGA